MPCTRSHVLHCMHTYFVSGLQCKGSWFQFLQCYFEAAFSLKLHFVQEKSKVLVNNECSYWYNRVGDFLKYQFGIRENSLCTMMDQHGRPDRTTPLQSAWSMALNAMTVECEQFIYVLLIFTNVSKLTQKKESHQPQGSIPRQ